MTEGVDGLIKSISINQILVAILEEHGKITVPTLKFLDAAQTDKELVVDFWKNSCRRSGRLDLYQ